MSAREPFFWVAVSCSLMVMAFIVFPILRMTTAPTAADL